MKYICDEQDKPMFYASYGSFIHKIIEKYYKGEISKPEMKTMFLFDFSKEVRGDRPSDKIVENYIKKGIEYLEGFEEFPYTMVAVEDKIHFDIDGLHFVGIVDYIGKTDDGFVIIDNKSRELKPRSNRKSPTKMDLELDEMYRQLYLYSYAIKSKYGEFPKKLCFNCFKNRTFIEEDFNKSKFDETIDWVKHVIDDIKSTDTEDFYPSIDYFGCSYICGLSDCCCYAER